MADAGEEARPFDLSFAEAPAELSRYVNAFYRFTTTVPVFREMMPAYAPQLMLIKRGLIRGDIGGGMKDYSGAVITSQLTRALPFELVGPFQMVGVSLTAHGWAALTGKPMNEWKDRFIPVAEVFASECAAKIENVLYGMKNEAIDVGDARNPLAEIITQNLQPLPEGHDDFVTTMQDWLTSGIQFDLDVLRGRLALPDRQIQRLSNRYFGSSPASMVKRYRAIMCASLIALEKLPEETETLIKSVYFDQAHLIRDILHFTGKTPSKIKLDLDGMSATSLQPQGYADIRLFDSVAAQTGDSADD